MPQEKDSGEERKASRLLGIRARRFFEALPVPTVSARSFFIFCVIFAFLLALLAIYLPRYYKVMEAETRTSIREEINPFGQALSAVVNEKTGIVYGLSAFAVSHKDTPNESIMFNDFAALLFPKDNSLVTVGISPGGVITYIYPYSPKSIGIDLVNDPRPDVKRDVAKTIAEKKAMIAGPVLHSSGKTVMVIRDPIFNDDGSFWGLTNVAFEKEPFLKSTGLDDLAKNYDFLLKEKTGDVLDGNKTVLGMNPVKIIIAVPGDTWILSVVPKVGWPMALGRSILPIAIAWIVAIFIFATLIAGAIDRQNILTKAVVRRTKQLTDSNIDLKRINRLYSMITAINETIVHANDETSLYNDVCRIAVDIGGFRMSWIGLVDEADQKVTPVAMAGTVDGYLDDIEVSARDIPEGRGPTGTAIRENKTIICSDIEHDPIMEPWRERAMAREYRASGAFPIRSEGSAIGALTIYDNNVGGFNREEVKLMEEIAADITFSLEKISQGRGLEHAASFPRVNPSPIVEFHASGLVLFHNEAAAKALERAGMAGQFEAFKPKDLELLVKLFVDNRGINTQYREVIIGERVYGEAITYFRENATVRIYTMDITDKKMFETELLKRQDELENSNVALSRTLTMYEVLGRVNEMIIKSGDIDKLFKELCLIMTETAGYDLAFVFIADNAKKTIKAIAASGKGSKFTAFIKGFSKDAKDNKNIKDSLATQEAFVCKDLKTCSCSEGWSEDLKQPGFEVYGIFPISNLKERQFAVAVFSRDPGL